MRTSSASPSAASSKKSPSIRFARDPQTKEFLLSGQGQLHVEIVVSKLHKKYGVDVILHPPKVPYRETITKPADAHGRHKSSRAVMGRFADCKISVEPLAAAPTSSSSTRSSAARFRGNTSPRWKKGIQDARLKGLPGRLSDGRLPRPAEGRPVPRRRFIRMAFKIAGSLAYQEAMTNARATLLEPIMHVDISAPSEYVGDIMGDLNSRRGRVEGVDAEEDMQTIHARVPMAEDADVRLDAPLHHPGSWQLPHGDVALRGSAAQPAGEDHHGVEEGERAAGRGALSRRGRQRWLPKDSFRLIA